MRFLGPACALGLVSGCGSPDCDESDFQGTYLVTWDRQSGDCGELSDSVVVVSDSDTSDDPACVDAINEKTDACTAQIETTCTYPQENRSLTMTGKIEQLDDDGNEAEGLFEFWVRDGGGQTVCRGTYTVKYERQ